MLLGSRNPLSSAGFSKDPDPFVLSEILEFGLSLAPVAKGQETFAGLPHLQAYRLLRAVSLTEVGYVPLAERQVLSKIS